MAELTGPQKAALVLLSLDEEVASEVIKHLDERDLKRLALTADGLSPLPLEQLEPTFEEFQKRMREPLPPQGGASAYLRKLTATSLGNDRAHRLFAPAAAPTQPPIEIIRAARVTTLAKLLEEEHPQVAAVIVSQLPREQAAKVLLALPPERQADVLQRVASLKELPAQMVDMASDALARALAHTGDITDGSERRTFNGVSFAAGVLNELPPAEVERLLVSFGPTHAKAIKAAMFTFEDLARIEVRALQILMREVSTDQLLIALKTASEDLREHFFKAVSSRAATAMREDLAAMPALRLSEVEKAQREVVEAALRLAGEKKLVLPGSNAEKLV